MTNPLQSKKRLYRTNAATCDLGVDGGRRMRIVMINKFAGRSTRIRRVG